MDQAISTIKYTKIFINNEWCTATLGSAFDVICPIDGRKIVSVEKGGKEDIDKAVKAARQAFKLGSTWRTMDSSARGLLLYKFADLLEREKLSLAKLETLNNGKPLNDAIGDIEASACVFRYYAGLADKIHGKTIPADGPLFAFTRAEPIGVCGQIIPWNYPIMMIAWKWAPCLAAGNTIVLKPSDMTPLTALYCASLTVEAGFPPGVINVVPSFGPEAGSAIVQHPDIDKVCFTGSTDVGRLVLQGAGISNIKRVTLELGGKSPLVIFNDFDVSQAAQIGHNAVFTNMGQNCCAGTRTYVHESIYDEFVAKSVQLAKERIVGDPFSESTQHGPQISQQQMEKILKMIEMGVKEGAKLMTGGKRIGEKGFFVEPTVFADVEDHMTIAKEEIFGPVQSILKFSTLEEVIERCNASKYGLGAGILTYDIDKALTFAQSVQSGSVWINCYDANTTQTPFGGYKMSGFGRELGEDAIKDYTEVKSVIVKIPQKNA